MVAHGCRKRKKLICGTEGEIVVAHGRLPSPTRWYAVCTLKGVLKRGLGYVGSATPTLVKLNLRVPNPWGFHSVLQNNLKSSRSVGGNIIPRLKYKF